MSPPATPTLFERLGGAEAIDAAVEAFHGRVADDDRVSGYFDGADMERVLRHQKAFFTVGTGGPGEYAGREIDAAHAAHAIDEEAFDVFVGHIEATLIGFGVPEVERGELLAILEEYRPAVVGA